MSQANTIQPYVVDSFNQQMIPASAYTLNNAVSWCGTTGQQQMWIKVSWHLLIDRKNGNKPKLIRVRDRLKNTLKPMKWNIFHFSLDPPPLRSEIPLYFWLHSMMVNTSMKPILFWKSEIVTMKLPTPSPLVKNISLHWLQGIFETVP